MKKLIFVGWMLILFPLVSNAQLGAIKDRLVDKTKKAAEKAAKDKKKCKAMALRGEREYAERYEEKRKQSKARSASFPLLQVAPRRPAHRRAAAPTLTGRSVGPGAAASRPSGARLGDHHPECGC